MRISKNDRPEHYSDTTIIKPGWFELIEFHGPRGATIEISAWESDKEDFSLYLLRREDVRKNVYRTERALLKYEKESDVEDSYTFDRSLDVCIVISNTHAVTHDKEVHLRVTWSGYPSTMGESSKETRKTVTESTEISRPSWKASSFNARTVILTGLLIAVIASPLLVGMVVWMETGNTAILTISGLLTAILSIVAGIFKSEIRAFLKLKSE